MYYAFFCSLLSAHCQKELESREEEGAGERGLKDEWVLM